VAGYIPRWFAQPKTVTHPGVNRARRRVTTLIDSNALLLCQTIKVGNRVRQITRGYADIAQFPCDRLSSIRMSYLVYTAIVPHYADLMHLRASAMCRIRGPRSVRLHCDADEDN